MRKVHSSLTRERLQEVLDYNAETGTFLWKAVKGKNRVKAGSEAGTIKQPDGYRWIAVDGYQYRGHRLAWFYIHGVWPVNQIDHRNGIPSDNRITNLRDVSNEENSQNSEYSHGTSKYRGVSWNREMGKWYAQIRARGKKHYLGLFASEEEAKDVYDKAREKLHPGYIRVEDRMCL